MNRSPLIALGTALLCASLFFMFEVPAWGEDAGQRAYDRGDYAAAFREFGRDGSAEAQMMLGMMYFKGQGVEQDKKRAVELLLKAAERGNVTAQLNLGFIYEDGEGVNPDSKAAARWYRRAAAQGDVDAQKALRSLLEKNETHEAKWVRSSAEKGDVKAQFNLASMYERGEGVVQDYEEAVIWYRRAAEQGFAMAQHNLGLICFERGGNEQDYKTAFEWFLKAAKQGYAPSQVILGTLYYDGIGVTESKVEAVKVVPAGCGPWRRKCAICSRENVRPRQGSSPGPCASGEVASEGSSARTRNGKANPGEDGVTLLPHRLSR
jgi:TPR repeat protein